MEEFAATPELVVVDLAAGEPVRQDLIGTAGHVGPLTARTGCPGHGGSASYEVRDALWLAIHDGMNRARAIVPPCATSFPS